MDISTNPVPSDGFPGGPPGRWSMLLSATLNAIAPRDRMGSRGIHCGVPWGNSWGTSPTGGPEKSPQAFRLGTPMVDRPGGAGEAPGHGPLHGGALNRQLISQGIPGGPMEVLEDSIGHALLFPQWSIYTRPPSSGTNGRLLRAQNPVSA